MVYCMSYDSVIKCFMMWATQGHKPTTGMVFYNPRMKMVYDGVYHNNNY